MSETLDRIIYGKPVVDNQPSSDFQTLALSGNLTYEDSAAWRALITLDPLADAAAHASQAVGIFTGQGRNFILARVHHQNDDPDLP
ncbi:MAG: hypothetical protein K8I30_02550, partial [Anaerolineae bacterium]|nr:hypothetical protein [Anaerolineae bacterium]